MGKFAEYFQKMFQLDSTLSLFMLVLLIPLLVLGVYKLTYHKEINSNGKVVLTRKWKLAFGKFLPTRITQANRKKKPFTRLQKRLLSLLYSAHEALFGLIIFAFGLGLITKVFIELINETQNALSPVMLTCALLGFLAMPIGVLLIYFRDADNPFDDN